jgi:hypothetical protein
MTNLIARLRAGTVTPADLDAAADAIEGRNSALVWIAENGKRGVAGGYLCAQVAAKALSK